MEVIAKATYLRISPRKLRLLIAGLSGLSPKAAMQRLEFYKQPGRSFVKKLVKQALANAVNNFKLQEENLTIKRVAVDEGPRIKRMDKSHGARFDRGIIKKRMSNMLLVLEAKETEKENGTKN